MAFDIKKNRPVVADKAKHALSRLENEIFQNADNVYMDIPLSSLSMHPDNSKIYDLTFIEELAEDIREVGLATPLLVRELSPGRYQIISGHRRYLACKEIDYEPVQAVVVKNVSDLQVRRLLIATNNYRTKTPLEQAREIKTLQEIYKQQKKELPARFQNRSVMDAIAEDLDMSPSTVRRTARINKLIPELQEMIAEEKLPPTTAERFADMEPETQRAIYAVLQERETLGGSISLAEATKLQQEYKAVKSQLNGKEQEIKALKKEMAAASGKNAATAPSEAVQALNDALLRKDQEIQDLNAKYSQQIEALSQGTHPSPNAELVMESIRHSAEKIKSDYSLLTQCAPTEGQRAEIKALLDSLASML